MNRAEVLPIREDDEPITDTAAPLETAQPHLHLVEAADSDTPESMPSDVQEPVEKAEESAVAANGLSMYLQQIEMRKTAY